MGGDVHAITVVPIHCKTVDVARFERGNGIPTSTRCEEERNEKAYGEIFHAHTKKGKGVREMEENHFAWHHRAPTPEEYERFVKEIMGSPEEA